MKKFVSLLLAALLVLSLTACGSKNNHSGDKPATPTSALNILETVCPHDERQHLHRRRLPCHRRHR